jgi:hypothetical protein
MTSKKQGNVPEDHRQRLDSGASKYKPRRKLWLCTQSRRGWKPQVKPKADAQYSVAWAIVRTANKNVVLDFEIYPNGPYPLGLDTPYVKFTGEYDNIFLELVHHHPPGESPARSLSLAGHTALTMKKTTHGITATLTFNVKLSKTSNRQLRMNGETRDHPCGKSGTACVMEVLL